MSYFKQKKEIHERRKYWWQVRHFFFLVVLKFQLTTSRFHAWRISHVHISGNSDRRGGVTGINREDYSNDDSNKILVATLVVKTLSRYIYSKDDNP